MINYFPLYFIHFAVTDKKKSNNIKYNGTLFIAKNKQINSKRK